MAATSTAPAATGQVRIRNHSRDLWYFLEIPMGKGKKPKDIVLGDCEAKVDLGEAPSEVVVSAAEWAALLESDRYGESVQAMLDSGKLSKYAA